MKLVPASSHPSPYLTVIASLVKYSSKGLQGDCREYGMLQASRWLCITNAVPTLRYFVT